MLAKCQEGSVPNMSPLIYRIPHCSVKILLKTKGAAREKKGAEQCLRDAGRRCHEKPCADHDTLDRALECAWLLPSSFSLLPPSLFFSALLHSNLRREQREERARRRKDRQ